MQRNCWYTENMDTIEVRVKQAQEQIIPILKGLCVDIGSQVVKLEDGHFEPQLTWVDTAPAPETPPAA